MKIFPKSFSLNIFGKKVPVKVIDGLMESGIAGLFKPQTEEIYIAKKQTKDDAVHTLLHEIGHAVIQRTGIKQAIPHEIEEVIVENMATVIIENFTISLKKK